MSPCPSRALSLLKKSGSKGGPGSFAGLFDRALSLKGLVGARLAGLTLRDLLVNRLGDLVGDRQPLFDRLLTGLFERSLADFVGEYCWLVRLYDGLFGE